MTRIRTWAGLILLLGWTLLIVAQQNVASGKAVVPPLVNFSGIVTDGNGKPLTGVVGVTFYLYKDQEGGAPLWMETQNIYPDKAGHYNVMLGSTTSTGLPFDIFVGGEARWLGVQVQGQAEQARVLLLSVPYALKAGDAETIGGLPPSAFVLAAPPFSSSSAVSASSATAPSPVASVGGTGTTDFIPIWTNSATLGNSVLFQSGTGSTARIGINTTTPGVTLDINGSTTIRGILNLPSAGTATSTTGKKSQPLDQIASSFNSGTGKAASQEFRWLAEPSANNTASPSGTLNLLFGSNGAIPAETGLRIAGNGQITFAAGQTFPVIQNLTVSGDLQAQFGSFTGSNTGDILIVQNQNTSGGIGIVGSSAGAGGIGMEGNSLGSGGAGVQGSSSGANGVGIKGSGATGVTGIGSFPTSVGVSGTGGTQSTSFGVIGTSGGVGVAGTGNLTPGSGGVGVTGAGARIGVSGSSGSNGTGIVATGGNIGLSATGVGLAVSAHASGSASFGIEASGTFAGIVATASQTKGFSNGVFGSTASVGGMGGLFEALGESKIGAKIQGCCPVGVWGDTGSSAGGAAGLVGTADDARAIYLENNSPSGVPTAFMQQDAPGKFALVAGGPTEACTIDTAGALFCPGGTSVVASIDAGQRQVALYAVQSPQHWFEDFGSGQLTSGAATVTLDVTFAETVNASADYHVFLTPVGDCRGLYVNKKSANGFEVHELGGGKSNVAFDYRIVAVRRGFEGVRLEDMTEKMKTALVRLPRPTGKPMQPPMSMIHAANPSAPMLHSELAVPIAARP